MHDFPPFPGFQPAAFQFLQDLAAHNDRDWFKPRKATFDDEVQWPMQCLVAEVGQAMPSLGLPVKGDPKRGLFRIYRDTRFSKNKEPYKTWMGAVVSRSGSINDNGVLYFHVQPEQCFLAAGWWMPEAPFLRAWRERMVADPEAFLGMTEDLATHHLSLDPSQSLKRMPQGYEAFADHALSGPLKFKSFVVTRPVPEEALQSPGFAQTAVQFAQEAAPLLHYGWAVEARQGVRVPA
jgi:uncharacterized protein (TIGR02453 family)